MNMKTTDTDKIFSNKSYPPQEEAILKPLSLKELMNKKFPELEWVVDKLIPNESIVALSGLPASGKTWIILQLALSVSGGSLFLDVFPTRQTGVLIIDEEMGERWIQERIQQLSGDADLPVSVVSLTNFKITKESIKELLKLCGEENIGLIILDSLIRVHTARDENDSVEMAKVFAMLKPLSKNGISILFTQHNRKPARGYQYDPSQDMRGSSDILAAVDSHIALKNKDDEMLITQTKLRHARPTSPFKVKIVSEGDKVRLEYDGEISIPKSKKVVIQEAARQIIKEADKPMYKKEIFDALKAQGVEGGYSTYKTALEEMIGIELIEHKGEKNVVYLTFKEKEEG